ncbi:hypothetical protein [Pseudooceanicola sp. LIPI14-2-Ac024]|uniref:hypothetical protein n=1 Tax=Pseudooceanicola sp. LIPI14-2-Ac024 TaxID=3344875 RepID=UPI0035CF2215
MGFTKNEKKVILTILEKSDRDDAENAIIRVLLDKFTKFLADADEAFLTEFFTRVEMIAPATSAQKIALHDLRPEGVTKQVEARRAESTGSRKGRAHAEQQQ